MKTNQNSTSFLKIICKKSFYICTLVMALAFAGCKDDDDDDNNNTQPANTNVDRDFMVNVALSNLAEIELGQVAATRGALDTVKAYGRAMVAEHTLAQNELKTLAANKQVTLPTTLDTMHVALKQRLQNLSGRQFDSVYVNSQIMDHTKTKAIFETEINAGKDADVKSYANKNLPHINM
ncbi:MAG TPA: DUF4142 domain-containing protein, partial [Cytophagaceae bacterium]